MTIDWESVARALYREFADYSAADPDGADVTPLDWFVKRYGTKPAPPPAPEDRQEAGPEPKRLPDGWWSDGCPPLTIHPHRRCTCPAFSDPHLSAGDTCPQPSPSSTGSQEGGERVTSYDVLAEGGDWLGAARNWIKWHCHNGSDVTWGSGTVLSPALSVRQVEEVSAEAVAADRRARGGGRS